MGPQTRGSVITPRVSVDILTAIRSPAAGLDLTAESLLRVASAFPNFDLRWTLVSADLDSADKTTLISAQQLLRSIDIFESDGTTYEALNIALGKVRSDWFMVLHAGDTLSTAIGAVDLPGLDNQKIHCFVSDQHDIHGMTSRRRKSHSWKRIMPGSVNHQAMLFPRGSTAFKYDVQFPVAADLDLKLLWWRAGALEFHHTTISSCLTGGRSMRVYSWAMLRERVIEDYAVFRRHYGVAASICLVSMRGLRQLGLWLSPSSH